MSRKSAKRTVDEPAKIDPKYAPMIQALTGDNGQALPEKIYQCWPMKDPIYLKYHNYVYTPKNTSCSLTFSWGRPEFNDQLLFAKLILDGFQAGLSFLTILKKTPTFVSAFEGFDAKKIAKYNQNDVERLMQDSGIIRNRSKILSTIGNAKVDTVGSFARYLWSFVNFQPIIRTSEQLLTTNINAEQLSADLKRRGFRFVGPTIVYAFMQAVGMVNDHGLKCELHKKCQDQFVSTKPKQFEKWKGEKYELPKPQKQRQKRAVDEPTTEEPPMKRSRRV